MFCKYCKSPDHFIDNCTDIICRQCKQYGHPHWKCKNKQQNTFQQQSNNKNQKNNKQTSVPQRIIDHQYQTIQDYYQYMGKTWSELC